MSLFRSLSKSNSHSSTQKDNPPSESSIIRTKDDIKVQPQSVRDDQSIWPPDDMSHAPLAEWSPQPKSLKFEDIPVEVLEHIAGYLVGSLGAVSPDVVRNWNEHMRHPRRKDAGNLAFVSRIWRRLIQERLFRHIKIQGTNVALDECTDFFLSSPHLQRHVRHLQVISPIWEMKPGKRSGPHAYIPTAPIPRRDYSGRNLQTLMPIPVFEDPVTPNEREQNQFFQMASGNASVEEIFGTAKVLFPELLALTVEAGHCKRPPQIQYFRPRSTTAQPLKLASASCHQTGSKASPMYEQIALPQLPKVTALMIKGAWNVIRTPTDFELLSQSLPSLREFSCNFHSLKTQAYATMHTVVKSHLPNNITHLSITLDGLYTKASSGLRKWRKIYPNYHICLDLASRLPHLTSLNYTGRVCHELFTNKRDLDAQEWPFNKTHALKSINVTVNALCCDPLSQIDNLGIDYLPFINGFEQLIFEAVTSLSSSVNLHHLRIRYIDLDSPRPLLNPSFHLEKGSAWGMWSERIVTAVLANRPEVKFLGRKDDSGLLYNEHEEVGDVWKITRSVELYRRDAKNGVLIH